MSSYGDTRYLLSPGICSAYGPTAPTEQESGRKSTKQGRQKSGRPKAAAAEGNRLVPYFLTWPDSIAPDHLPVGDGRCSMNSLKRFKSFSTRPGVAWISLSPTSPMAPCGGS